ncbi:MAG: acyl-CoA synthetase [Alphaproteobacteria bacterium]|nr:acyl-CoA synthetase [Alphaproteobacteria bacterium]MBU2379540.1 acyl-CoA synthetase [Alphaproteobacteria bacterium]
MTLASAVPTSAPVASRGDIRALEAAGWPSDLPTSTYALLQASAARFGDQPAVSFFLETKSHRRPETLSYRDLLADVTRTANFFGSLGVEPNDVVALVLPNLIETHLCLWGGEAAGVVFPINPLMEAEAISALLRESGAKVVVTLAPFPGADLYDKVVAATASAQVVETIALVDLAPHVRGPKRWAARLAQARMRRRAAPVRKDLKVVDFGRELKRMKGTQLDSGRVIAAEETASIFGTGGTTGSPKVARRTHANEVANAWMSSRMIVSGLTPGSTFFAGLPLFHVNGAMVTGLSAFLLGTHVLIGTPQGFRGTGVIDRFWEIATHHGVTAFSGVPTLFSALLQRPVQGHDLSRLAFGICGAAPMSPELLDQFQRTTGVKVLEGYGLTEATCVAAVHALDGVQKIGSVGLPLPFQAVLIAHPDERGGVERLAGIDEVGAVLLAGPNVFQGYTDARHDRALWVEIAGERWLNTGDLGLVDADGFLWLKGRAKDLIIRGGHNIDPAMIEDAFFSHPAVELAAAIGRPDPHAGEVPVVYVQLKPGVAAGPDALAAHAEARIHERAARPKAVHLIEVMPLTAVGKVHKPTLRQIDAERLNGADAPAD